MDVMSSDIYGGDGNSDDSFPEMAEALGLKRKKIQQTQAFLPNNRGTANQENRIPAMSQETSSRTNRVPPDTSPYSIALMQRYMDQTLPRASQATLTRTAPARPNVLKETRVPASSRIEIDLDAISSSSPFPSFNQAKPAANRAKSFNSVEPILSSSPLPRVPPVRTPLNRASTFHSMDHIHSTPPVVPQPPSFQQPDFYHEISDDDEDLRAAIAASLASLETPKPTPATIVPMNRSTSTFQCPDEVFRSSPPPSQKSARARSEAPYIPRATPPSNQVRHDTQRLLDALDHITTNVLEREPVEAPTRSKKKPIAKITGTETTEIPKPKKRGLTQEQRVILTLIITDIRTPMPLSRPRNNWQEKLNVLKRLFYSHII